MCYFDADIDKDKLKLFEDDILKSSLLPERNRYVQHYFNKELNIDEITYLASATNIAF